MTPPKATTAEIKKICLVVANEMTVKAFLKEPILALARRYAVTVVVNASDRDFAGANSLPARVISVAIARDISPLADVLALRVPPTSRVSRQSVRPCPFGHAESGAACHGRRADGGDPTPHPHLYRPSLGDPAGHVAPHAEDRRSRDRDVGDAFAGRQSVPEAVPYRPGRRRGRQALGTCRRIDQRRQHRRASGPTRPCGPKSEGNCMSTRPAC